MEDAYIVGAFRSPIGKFMGGLSSLTAPRLAAKMVDGMFERLAVGKEMIEEVIVGNVLSAGLGQNPAKQVAVYSGINNGVATFNVNMVCASGLKAIALAAQAVQSGSVGVALAGGMESMTNAPHSLKGARQFKKYGNVSLSKFYHYANGAKLDYTLIDEMINAGLWDCYSDLHMGALAEKLSSRESITREDEDRFAYQSHLKAAAAADSGKFAKETIPISLPGGSVLALDEGIRRDTSLEKLAQLKPAFVNSGTVTAGNSSQLSDGAAFAVVASGSKVKEYGLAPVARVEAYADSGIDPSWYGLAPIESMTKALRMSGHTLDDMDIIEINEAFCVQVLSVAKEMHIDMERLNVNGGAIALGHPIGASGARIVATLTHALKDRGKSLGIVSLCHGGGGSSSMVISRVG